MTSFRDLPIRRKLVLAMVGVSVVAVGFVAVLRIALQLATFRNEAANELQVQSKIIADNSAAALEFDSTATAQETLDSLRTNPNIMAAAIYRRDGSVLASYRSQQGLAVVKQLPAVGELGASMDGRHMVFYHPVTRSGERVGTVLLRSNLQPQYQRLVAGIEIALIAMVAAIVLAVVLALRLQRTIAGPIVSLAQVAEQVTKHEDFSVRANRSSNDEIGALTDAFNRMLTVIGERDAKLRLEEQRFRQLAETIREVFWLTPVDKNRMLYVSPVYEQIWGRTCADLYANPRSWMDAIHPDDRERVRQAALTRQAEGCYDEEYRIVRPDGSVRWIRDRAFPIRDPQTGTVYRIAGLAEDITEIRKNREALRRLSVQILQSQDEERRRIARELHDTTAQNLFGLGLMLGNLDRSLGALRPSDRQALNEALALVKQCTQELRTLSYLLHPPLLEEMGLPATLRHYIQGFTERTHIPVAVDVAEEVGRFTPETELALFRVLQESLTNIQKHSGSTAAWLKLTADDGKVLLEIQDNGKGFTAAGNHNGANAALGVGLSSMRERIEQLGGQLILNSQAGGTTVRASLPATRTA